MGTPELIASQKSSIPLRSVFIFPPLRRVWQSDEFIQLRSKYYVKPLIGRIFGFIIGFILSALANYIWVYLKQFDSDWGMMFLLTVVVPGLLICIGTVIRTARLTFGYHYRMMRDLLQRDKEDPKKDSEFYTINTFAPALLCLDVFTEAFDTFAGFFFGFVLIFLIEIKPDPSTVDFSIDNSLWFSFMMLAVVLPVAVGMPYVLAPSISLYSYVTRFSYTVTFSIIQTLAILFAGLAVFTVAALPLSIIEPVFGPASPSLAFLIAVFFQLLFLYGVISAILIWGRKIFMQMRKT